MKRIIVFVLFIIMSVSVFAPNYPIDVKKEVQEWQDRKFIENIKNTEFSADNLKRLVNILCKHPEIVYAQARHESAEFKSKLFLDYNNLFGMKVPNVRPTTAIGWAMGHASYSHWSESVYDYMMYQKYFESYLKIDFDYINYYDFLSGYGYATDKKYIHKIKMLVDKEYTSDFISSVQ